MKYRIALMLLTLLLASAARSADEDSLMRGKYLLQVGGCNDCHTVGFSESGGSTPTEHWMTGSPVGFSGPWGTSYAGNVRLRVQQLAENEWLAFARTPMLPPMPSPALQAMTDEDLTAIYRYLRSLGPKGESAPGYVMPGQPVNTPFISFVPVAVSATSH